MELQESFELFKTGNIAKGSQVVLTGGDKPVKINEISNVDEENGLFSFTVFNSSDIYQSADIDSFVSKPYDRTADSDGLKRQKDTSLVNKSTSVLSLQDEKTNQSIVTQVEPKETFVTIQPKVLDYLTKRISSKREKCPIVGECIALLNQYQEESCKDNLADVIIKLSNKLNDLL